MPDDMATTLERLIAEQQPKIGTAAVLEVLHHFEGLLMALQRTGNDIQMEYKSPFPED